MTDPFAEVTVLTRDISSGRIHRRLLVNDQLIPYGGEADNLDQAGKYEIVTADDLANAEPEGLCERCFPDVPEDAA